MLQFINYRMRVTLDDSRVLVGRFMAFDKHMNIVLADCEEFRHTKKKDISEKRALGFVLLRGDCVVSIAVESPPPPPPKRRPTKAPAGRGVPMAAGRGIPLESNGPAPGLAGPIPGVGIAAASMQPHVAAQPHMYHSGPPSQMIPPTQMIPPPHAPMMPPPPGPPMVMPQQQMMPPPPLRGYGRGGIPQALHGGPPMSSPPPGWGPGAPPGQQPQLPPQQQPPLPYGRGRPPPPNPPQGQ